MILTQTGEAEPILHSRDVRATPRTAGRPRLNRNPGGAPYVTYMGALLLRGARYCPTSQIVNIR